jgi:hypothetical protein
MQERSLKNWRLTSGNYHASAERELMLARRKGYQVGIVCGVHTAMVPSSTMVLPVRVPEREDGHLTGGCDPGEGAIRVLVG